MAFKLGLDYKFKNKVNKMMKKDWVVISDYSPSDTLIGQIHDFFKNLTYHQKCKDFLKKKEKKKSRSFN